MKICKQMKNQKLDPIFYESEYSLCYQKSSKQVIKVMSYCLFMFCKSSVAKNVQIISILFTDMFNDEIMVFITHFTPCSYIYQVLPGSIDCPAIDSVHIPNNSNEAAQVEEEKTPIDNDQVTEETETATDDNDNVTNPSNKTETINTKATNEETNPSNSDKEDTSTPSELSTQPVLHVKDEEDHEEMLAHL